MNNGSTLKFIIASAALTIAVSFAGATNAEVPVFSLNKISDGGQRSQDARASLSAERVRGPATYSVDFVPGSESVAGVNFDIVLEGAGRRAGVEITACESGSDHHNARCEQVAPDRIRVLVFSAPANPMAAAELVRFQVNGIVKGVQIEKSSVAVSDLSGQKIAPEIL